MQQHGTIQSDWLRFLDSKGLKQTYERKLIFKEILQINSHFDADQLYEQFRQRKERISRDTVYRTIPLMLEAGVIQKSAGPGKREYFEKIDKKGHHDHMVCLGCQRIIEFHSEEIERIQEDICTDAGFRLVFHDHKLLGYCDACAIRENGK